MQSHTAGLTPHMQFPDMAKKSGLFAVKSLAVAVLKAPIVGFF